jgi:hypothetical protein
VLRNLRLFMGCLLVVGMGVALVGWGDTAWL